VLTEMVRPQLGSDLDAQTDLSALAEHLSFIADALRKSTGSSGTNDSPALLKGGSGRGRAADATSNVVAAYPTANVRPGAPVVRTDINMQRRQYADIAKEAYAVRRRRTVIFDNSELFGEPAWDILLDLYIAHVEHKQVSVSSACIGSAAPPTTGLRWLGVLSEQGLILREHDPEDQRRVLVRLTGKGLAAMDDYFASLDRKA